MTGKLNTEALRWLVRHDGEYDWEAHDRHYRRSWVRAGRATRDYVGAVRDNLRDFGIENAGRMSRALRRAAFP